MAQVSHARRLSAKRFDGSNTSTLAPATPPTTTPAKPSVQPLNLLTAKQATERLGISVSTFERLIRKKALRLFRVGPGGPRRFRLDDVDRALIPDQKPEPSADISSINTNAQVEEA